MPPETFNPPSASKVFVIERALKIVLIERDKARSLLDELNDTAEGLKRLLAHVGG